MSNFWMIPAVEYYKIFFTGNAKIVFDIGSRDGQDALLISDALGAEVVYAIEARKDAAKNIKEAYPSFKVISKAISDYSGTTDFYEVLSNDADYSGSSSIYNNKFERAEYPHKVVKVPVTTMAEIIKSNKLEDTIIDFVKVDIEGYTYELLTGMSHYLHNVKMFHLETETNSTHDNHKNNWEVADLMRRNGFALVAKQYEWGEDIEDQVWVNKSLVTNEVELAKWQTF